MKNDNYWWLVLLGMLIAMMSGCFVASAPVYPGDMSALSKNLNPVDKETAKGRMKMMLPEGWRPSKMPSHASNWAAEISGAYEKDMGLGSAVLVTTCYTSFISKGGIADALRGALDPKAVKVMGPYSIDGPTMLDPEFEVYDMDTIKAGKKVPMSFLIAWKLDSSIGGCKYGLQMVGLRQFRQQMLNDMLAILKTLN